MRPLPGFFARYALFGAIGAQLLLGCETIQLVEKDWKICRCPHYKSVLFEINVNSLYRILLSPNAENAKT